MKAQLVPWITWIPTTRLGMALERGCVRWTGYSFVGLLFSAVTGHAYPKTLLLTTVGAKTGRRRSVVLPYYFVGGQMTVVGSKGGAPTDPAWAKNIRVNPNTWIRINRKLRPATAHIALGAERVPLWEAITHESSIYLQYQQRTTREIPVVVLIPKI